MSSSPRSRLLPLGLLLLLALPAGCGGDSSGPADSGPPPMDQCTGASDLAIIEGLFDLVDAGLPDGGVPDGGPYPYAYEVALGTVMRMCTDELCIGAILTDNNAEQCVSDCLDMTAAAGVSGGCIGCQNELIRCTTANCVNLCLGSDEAACNACVLTACGERMGACTGFEAPL